MVISPHNQTINRPRSLYQCVSKTAGGNPAMESHPIHGRVEILLVVSCDRNWDKLLLGEPFGCSYADFTYLTYMYVGGPPRQKGI